jgi:hypothetical protein
MKRILAFLTAFLIASSAFGQNVQELPPVTFGHLPYWVTSGVIGDAGSSTDSPVTSIGVTNNGGAGICISSDRQSAAGRNQLCFGASTSSNAVISLQNYGTAPAEGLVFNINGVLQGFPTVSPLPTTAGSSVCFLNTTGQLTQCTATSGKAPKFQRFVSINTVFSFTPDANATLLDIVLVGPGGGGTGNGAANRIPFSQYGFIGSPTAFGVTPLTVTISNAAPGIVTTPTHTVNWECNRPFYFINNGDTLPSPLSFNSVYIMYCGDNPIVPGSNTNAPTPTTFGISTASYSTPITCIIYAPNCQTAITTTTAGSGTHILNMYTYVATSGSGGGGVGDGGLPGTYMGCDSNGPAGYLQSVGVTGGVGGNFYGNNIAPGIGGAGRYGGMGMNSGVGTDFTGGGGSGAFPLATASGGGGGGGGGSCHIIIKPVPGTSYPMLCGLPGLGGVAATQSVTFTNASPTVMTATASNFPPNGAVSFTGGSLPTGGITAGTTYYTSPTDESGNTYNLLVSPYSTLVNTTSTGSGTVTSGTAGSRGSYGSCEVWQYYGGE